MDARIHLVDGSHVSTSHSCLRNSSGFIALNSTIITIALAVLTVLSYHQTALICTSTCFAVTLITGTYYLWPKIKHCFGQSPTTTPPPGSFRALELQSSSPLTRTVSAPDLSGTSDAVSGNRSKSATLSSTPQSPMLSETLHKTNPEHPQVCNKTSSPDDSETNPVSFTPISPLLRPSQGPVAVSCTPLRPMDVGQNSSNETFIRELPGKLQGWLKIIDSMKPVNENRNRDIFVDGATLARTDSSYVQCQRYAFMNPQREFADRELIFACRKALGQVNQKITERTTFLRRSLLG